MAFQQPRPRSAKILAFDGVMGNAQRKKQKKTAPSPAPAPSRWHMYRETISVFWPIGLAFVTVGGFFLTLYVNKLIDDKLAPINQQLQTMNRDLGEALGQLKKLDAQIKTLKPTGPNLLAQDNSPVRGLADIQANLALAEQHRLKLTTPDLVAYKKQVQSVASSAKDYWTTVAAIINYQSYLNQVNYNFPDPGKVARPCMFVTQEAPNATIHVRNNRLLDTQYVKDCIVDIDTNGNTIEDAVIRDSVVHYHGGKVTFMRATFINCRFIVDIKTPQIPTRPDLLLALLNSDQVKFTLPAAG